MCEYCDQEPVFEGNVKEECYYNCHESEKELTNGGWTTLYIGADEKGRIILRACGDGYTDNFYPNYCPMCGRKLTEDNNV